MLELEKNNNLSWETFNTNYTKEKIYTQHSTLFANDNMHDKELLEISSEENNMVPCDNIA